MYHRNFKFEPAALYADANVDANVIASVTGANSEEKYVSFSDENMSQVITDIGDA